MSEPGNVRPGADDDRLSAEHFLVDGVAPAVIGGDPQAENYAVDDQPKEYQDPPTAPIPAAKPESHKSWLSRVFSPRSSR